jgi:hypothetical protein
MRLASFVLKDSQHPGFNAEIETKLKQLPGVSDVLIGEPADTCSIVYDQATVSTLMLRNLLQSAGYDCQIEIAPPATSCCGACS